MVDLEQRAREHYRGLIVHARGLDRKHLVDAKHFIEERIRLLDMDDACPDCAKKMRTNLKKMKVNKDDNALLKDEQQLEKVGKDEYHEQDTHTD